MENDINEIKRHLSDELIDVLRQCDDSVLKDLVENGYSSFEIIDMITNYNNKSGADIINCTEVVKKNLVKSKSFGTKDNSK